MQENKKNAFDEYFKSLTESNDNSMISFVFEKRDERLAVFGNKIACASLEEEPQTRVELISHALKIFAYDYTHEFWVGGKDQQEDFVSPAMEAIYQSPEFDLKELKYLFISIDGYIGMQYNEGYKKDLNTLKNLIIAEVIGEMPEIKYMVGSTIRIKDGYSVNFQNIAPVIFPAGVDATVKNVDVFESPHRYLVMIDRGKASFDEKDPRNIGAAYGVWVNEDEIEKFVDDDDSETSI